MRWKSTSQLNILEFAGSSPSGLPACASPFEPLRPPAFHFCFKRFQSKLRSTFSNSSTVSPPSATLSAKSLSPHTDTFSPRLPKFNRPPTSCLPSPGERQTTRRGKTNLGRVLLGELPNDLGVVDGKLDGLLLVVLEDNRSEEGRGGVVHVNDDVLGSGYRGKGALNEVLSGGSKNLDEQESKARKSESSADQDV
jgi:hypothetical protein